jgi:ring-1,2-phenylacetyl-CoA epoxidase subunit PaaD
MPSGSAAQRTRVSLEQVQACLAAIPDPEIPVIGLADLGIIREVRYDGETLVVAVAPTYSGCPATAVINLEIETALRGLGVEKVRLERRLSPPWTTDWISAEGREKLRAYGIAPPVDGTAADGRLLARARLGQGNRAVACPRCGSARTEEISRFGSTPCKAAWRCRDCLEPFDYFKCL